MSRFLSQRFAALEAYTPGEQPQDMQYVKLNTNESPFPPSPEVIAAVNAAQVAKLNLYPDPTCRVLKEKLAALYGLAPENVFISNGSDDILNFSFMAFCDESRPVAFPAISYGFYPVYADLYHLPYTAIPLRENFRLEPEDYCGLNQNIVIANPNAPTGRAISPADIEKIVASNPNHVVLIDEAYVDFGGESCRGLIPRYENLLVCQTFSKSRSMAGGRLGFALGNAALIADLEKIKYSTNPYNINRLTLVAAEAAVDSNDYYVKNCRIIAENREYTVAALSKLGFETVPSVANFIFTRCSSIKGDDLYRKLKAKGILVRHWNKPEIQDYVRVTIGSREQMDIFLARIQELLKEE